ncbi:MAG: tail fiber domain-containing protein, partial [Bacteroidales bacterium]|nr:tail fiber domain-containing protein [Bacteroidales bacterium]
LAGYGITDADNSNTNEIQTLSLSGTQLSLSLGGGTVTLPSSGGGDNWGTQVVVTDATLAGNGTTATPLRIADNGVTSAKIADGTIVRADLAENSVTSEKIVDGTIVTADLADNVITNAKIINTAVTTDKLANSAVTAPKLASMGATAGDVLKFNGSAWMPGIDEGLTIPYSNYASTSTPLFTIENYDTGHGSAIYALSKGAYGIHGISYSTSGVGVRGLATADNGTNYGVYGRSESPDGFGVVGYNAAADGHAIGVRGESSSTKGMGVFGMASSAIGWTHGVRGRSESPNGYGVSGFAAAGIGNTYGIHGASASNQGHGVFGYTSAGSGITYAVAGRANSTEGRGVFGDAAATSGTNYGVYGKTASPQGYAGYFEGQMHVSGNVGIGTINPAYKLDIAGGMNLNKGITSGVAIRCNGAEALTYNGTYFSFGFGNPGNYSVFGRKVCIGTTSDPGEHHLVVNGTAAKPGGGSWATWSDERLKDIHGVYSKGLSEIILLQPVSFSYRETNSLNLPADKEYVGLIAQDVREILPEAVTEGQDGYLQLDIHPVNVALINAVKELNDKINNLKHENDRLKSENEQINSRIARLEEILSAAFAK